jgi:HEAT repeat protein
VAVQGLGRMGPMAKPALPQLIEIVKGDPSESVRFYAVPALLRSLADDAPSIRMGAAEALAAIGDRAVIPALEGLLEDKDDFVRDAARASLEKLGVAQQ